MEEGWSKQKYVVETMAEDRKACGGWRKVADEMDEMDEIVEIGISKKVGRRSRSVLRKIVEANRRSIDIHNQIEQIATRQGR
jgi:hypothetical protein